jgi:hypothetical protein
MMIYYQERYDMKQIAESLLPFLGKGEALLRENVLKASGNAVVYVDSIHAVGKAAVFPRLAAAIDT